MIPIQLLRKVSIFEGLTDTQLERIAEICSEETHPAGSLILEEGEPAERLYILREGRVSLEMGVRMWPERRVRQLRVEVLNAGQPFGLSTLTNSDVWTMSARAVDRCRSIALGAQDLRRLMDSDPAMGYEINAGLTNVLAERLRYTRLSLTEFLGQSQVAEEQTPEESTAIRRIQYGINFRWIAIIGVVMITLTANVLFGIHFSTLPILVIAAVIALYNLSFLWYTQRLDAEEPEDLIPKVRRYVWVQSVADLVATTAIIHFAGGVENPLVLYYVFHVILASIILPYRSAYLLATLAVVLFTSLAALEYFQIIPHVHLDGLVPPDLYLQAPYVMAVLFGFGTTLYISTYLTTAIAGELRKRQRETVALRDRLLLEADELQKANEELIKLDRLKTYFLAMASHDLKTPLAAVQSYLQVLLGGFVGELNEEHGRILQRCSQRIKELFDLINRFLDLAQIEKGKVVEEMEMICIRDVLESCVEEVSVLAGEKAQELNAEIPQDLPNVYGSANHLKQVVTNLLSNGVKFTPELGSITLRAREMENEIEVSVTDTGIGIDADDLPHLFEQFFRGKGGAAAQGTGLGLSISKRIVEAHHGTIWAESPYNEGQSGARFVFTLPKEQPAGMKVFGE
ncbi:MAG TPA: ATP-binding protein [Anaerolineae bacterium]|nr:ATP-binding protein [Anaerolineae bacterium]